MKRNTVFKEILKELSERLRNSNLGSQARKAGTNAFSRNGNMGCRVLVLTIINGIHSQLQIAIDKIYACLEIGTSVTRQAVSKARGDLEPEYIREMLHETAEIASSCEDLELYAGKYRLCAIDGSGVSLKQTLGGVFGVSNGKATALASLAYDPLNNIVMDGSLNVWGSGEREAAKANIEACEKIMHGRPCIYIFDRGYPSGEFIGDMMKKNLKFLFRVSKQTTVYQEAEGRGEWVSLDYEWGCYKVRVIKPVLQSGEIETLVTNLSEDELPYDQAGSLYFKRWCIEVKLDELKSKLALERMRGKREVVVLQDYYATLWLSNLAATLRWQTDAKIEQADKNKPHKYTRKTDVNRLLYNLRDRFYLLVGAQSHDQRQRMTEELVRDIARFPVDIKPNRNVFRKPTPRPRPCDDKNCVGLWF
jgi:hypothetical protein